ncbi:MAG TPA: hypothetical protein VN088_17065 [Nocardioides sp.]|nr:hypothetical protein [Nocardioides sp.]
MPQVDLLVWNEMLPNLPDALDLMKAREVKRTREDERATRVTLDMPYVPDGATMVEPNLQRTEQGVRVQSLSWIYPT